MQQSACEWWCLVTVSQGENGLLLHITILLSYYIESLQHFDTVGWVTARCPLKLSHQHVLLLDTFGGTQPEWSPKNKLCGRPTQYAPAPCKLTFDLLTSKVVSESRMTWPTSMPILVFLGLSVLNLGPMYVTDRRQTDVRRASSLNASALWGRGHNKPVKQKPKQWCSGGGGTNTNTNTK